MSNVDVISQTQRIVVDNSSTPIDSSKSQRIVVDPVTNTTIVVSVPAIQNLKLEQGSSSISVINAGPVGPSGPPGPGGSGSGGAGYNHTQSTAALTWVINHNLGYKPSIQTFTVGGLEVLGEVQQISVNQITVAFNTAIAGSARLT
jgi:hypothetical protein